MQRSWTLWLSAAALLGSAAPPAAAQSPEPTGLQLAAALEDVLVRAIERAEESVVSIARYNRNPNSDAIILRRDPIRPGVPLGPATLDATDLIPNDYASGVIVENGKNGILVLTTLSAVQGDGEIWVTTAAGRPLEAEVRGPRNRAQIIGGDPRSDLAVLRIIDAAPEITFKPITFGDATKLKKGQIVVALGNPYAIARDGKASASWGIIANLARKAAPIPPGPDANPNNQSVTKPTIHHFGTLIQTDAKLNQGTSGGALLNLKGEMIGLTTSQAPVAGFEEAAGYAIPVDDLFMRALKALKEGKEVEFGFLGVQPAALGVDRQNSGLQGISVVTVVPGMPAARAGVVPGDVITHIGEAAIRTVDDLMLQVGRRAAADETTLTLDRQGRVHTVPVRLAKYNVQGRKIVTSVDSGWRGLRVDFPSPTQLDVPFGVVLPQTSPAVSAVDVERDSPAWNAGLRPGKLITHVNNTSIETPKEFYEQVKAAKGVVQLRIGVTDVSEPPVVKVGE